jgi:ferredoxin
MLVIDPDECIDCALCEPACPVDAIWSDDDLPEEQIPFIAINELKAAEYKNIIEQQLPKAEESPYSLAEAIAIIQAE